MIIRNHLLIIIPSCNQLLELIEFYFRESDVRHFKNHHHSCHLEAHWLLKTDLNTKAITAKFD